MTARPQQARILALDCAVDAVAQLERLLPDCEIRVAGDFESARLSFPDPSLDLVIAELPRSPEGLVSMVTAVGEHPTTAQWVFLVDQEATDEEIRIYQAGAFACLVSPPDDDLLCRTLAQAVAYRGVVEQNRRLLGTVKTMQDCRQIVHCLEPGKLYPMALDLLLQTTQRSRGFALFQCNEIPQSESVALRGFSEADTPRVCRALLAAKQIDMENMGRIEVLDRGVLHEALRAAEIEIAGLLIVPLAAPQAQAGIVCIFEEGRCFEGDELERVGIVASHSAAALQNAVTYSMAKERAFIDDVTEVYNARYLLSTTENEIQRAERYGNPLSLLFLDLDRFKRVNDKFGHLIGSETLRRLSRLLGEGVRQVDTLARYGGDEFTILLVDTGHAEALAIAERIRSTIEEAVFEISRDAHLQLTISIGVATCPEHGARRDKLIDSADKAMYRAKSQGRNRICSADELD